MTQWGVALAFLVPFLSGCMAIGDCGARCDSCPTFVDSDNDGHEDDADSEPIRANLVFVWHFRAWASAPNNETQASIIDYFASAPYLSPDGNPGIGVTFSAGDMIRGDLSQFRANQTHGLGPWRAAVVHVFAENADSLEYAELNATGFSNHSQNAIVLALGEQSRLALDQYSWMRWLFMHELQHLLWPEVPAEYQRPEDQRHATTNDPIGFSNHSQWHYSDAFWREKAGEPLFPKLAAFNEFVQAQCLAP